MKANGYIVGKTGDYCASNFAQFNHLDHAVMYDQPADHEGFSFACDPNYQEPYSMFGVFKGPNSVLRRCLNEKDSNAYPLEYGKQFLKAYKDQKTVLYLEFMDAHEMSGGNTVQYLDQPLTNFL